MEVVRPDQVWSTDITFIPLERGWAFLVIIAYAGRFR